VDVITAEVAPPLAARMLRTDVREADTKATRRQRTVVANAMKAAMHTQVARDRAQLMPRHHTPVQRMAHRTPQQRIAVVARLMAAPLTVAAHLMAAVGSTRNPSDQIGRRRNIKTAESRRRYVSTQI
jgi:hypothetical protein